MDTAPHPTDPTDSGTRWALLTVEAAADQLSISRTTMYALLKNGDVTSLRIGRLRRVPAEALVTYTARLHTEQNAA
jgi:excisionase family DNA binding protein